MARARYLKPDFWKNEELASLPYEARLLFQGLWNLADREGRLEDRPMRIKADIFPYGSEDVNALLNQLAAAKDKYGVPLIIRYQVAGVDFIQVVSFVKHQNPHCKEPESKIPAPDKNSASTVQEQCKHSASSAESESYTESLTESEKRAKRAPSLAEWTDYAVSQGMDKPDAERAWHHYESQSWMRGKTPITKWKSCVATCLGRSRAPNPKSEVSAIQGAFEIIRNREVNHATG